jgi:hypothetical protein
VGQWPVVAICTRRLSGSSQLNQWLATQDENVLAQGSVVEWATESHNMARDQVYTFSSLNRLNEDYVSRMIPIVEAQLA